MDNRIKELMEMESMLLKAVNRGEFFLEFQPYFDLRSGRVAGAEALLRWKDERGNSVSPAKFVPVLEGMGLIDEVGLWVLRKACSVAEKTRKRIAVNVSPIQFKDRDFPDKVESILKELAVEGWLLTLEITEGTIMEDIDFARRSLKRLKKLGIKIAVDDFGTGYSSLSYLKLLPVDFLKIDVSFVKNIDRDYNDRAIVNAIIQLAKNLGFRTIAEGIESEKHLNILLGMGCDMGQGFYLARPVREEELLELLKI